VLLALIEDAQQVDSVEGATKQHARRREHEEGHELPIGELGEQRAVVRHTQVEKVGAEGRDVRADRLEPHGSRGWPVNALDGHVHRERAMRRGEPCLGVRWRSVRGEDELIRAAKGAAGLGSEGAQLGESDFGRTERVVVHAGGGGVLIVMVVVKVVVVVELVAVVMVVQVRVLMLVAALAVVDVVKDFEA
jgi:hypothetical protein